MYLTVELASVVAEELAEIKDDDGVKDIDEAKMNEHVSIVSIRAQLVTHL